MNKTTLAIMLTFFASCLYAQNEKSLLSEIKEDKPANEKVDAAFKSTRVINAQSIEMLHKGNLDLRILHRFGRINEGINQFYGLDIANFRLGFDYGLTDNITVGIGRSTFLKEVDGFIKVRLVQQSTGYHASPLSIVIIGGNTVWTGQSFAIPKPSFQDRSAYYFQFLAGRKFSNTFSFQFSPIIVYRNQPDVITENNTIIALGGGLRYKVSNRMAITADYHHPLGGLSPGKTDPLSVGIDIETGGHVFQLHFTNATGMNERAYITQTSESFFNGDIHFGFNLSRIFSVGNKKNHK